MNRERYWKFRSKNDKWIIENKHCIDWTGSALWWKKNEVKKWNEIIKKTKGWKNEMKNINDNENTKERYRNDKW